MDDKQKAVWYLMIADDFLQIAKKSLDIYEDLKSKLGDESYNKYTVQDRMQKHENSINYNCKKCLAILEKARRLYSEAQFKDSSEMILDCPAIKSQCYFQLGNLNFEKSDYASAINYFQKSFDSDPNQESIYNIAMATINLPVEGGGMFAGKKKQAAIETKREQEISLLKKSIEFAPFSGLGIKCGRMLIDNYSITEFDI